MRIPDLIVLAAVAAGVFAGRAEAQPPTTGDTLAPPVVQTPPVAQDTVTGARDTTAAARDTTPPAPPPLTNTVDAVNPTMPPPSPATERAPIDAQDLELVFDREVFNYAAANRRDPFTPLTRDSGPLFEELVLRMIIYSPVPGQSIVVLADGQKKVHRLRVGESIGMITVTSIPSNTRAVFQVNEFGLSRTEELSLKNDNSKEGA